MAISAKDLELKFVSPDTIVRTRRDLRELSDAVQRANDSVRVITRGELLQAMAGSGRPISNATVQYWQRKGYVPLPLRKWHNGATRALYGPEIVETFKRVYDSIHRRETPTVPVVCPHCQGSGVALVDAEE